MDLSSVNAVRINYGLGIVHQCLSQKNLSCLIPDIIYGSLERDIVKIKDSWLHYFDSNFLGHDMHRFEELGHVVDSITEM